MKKLMIIFAVLLLGVGAGIYIGMHMPDGSDSGSQKAEREIAYWVAPMDANYRRDKPGKSPMGMDLVPVYADEVNGAAQSDENTIRIDPAVISNLGVRTAKVEKGSFRTQVQTVGYVDYDESKITHIHLRAEGWIEKLYVDSEGERVKKGDLLFEVYAPALVNAQGDYLNALSTQRRDIIQASEERLRALDIPDSLIDELKKTRKISQYVKIYAPQDGIVSSLSVREGMYVTPQMSTISLADLSSIWLLVDVFETQVGQMTEGLPAQVRLSYEPDKIWNGKVTYIYPQIDPKTRTLKVRLVFDNPDEVLKPDMYADVTIFGRERPNTLTIPSEALIRTGNSERVILALGAGKFQPAAVKAGMEAEGRVEILSGLTKGETVVTSAQFLIDSEASFIGSSIRMAGMEPSKQSQQEEKQSEKVVPDITGMGTVNKIKLDQRKLNVSHEPIEALGWPAMTMDFMVVPDIDMSTLKEGTMIHFKLRKMDNGMYEITVIEN